MRVDRARYWGWHQLDSTWAQRIVCGAGIRPGDLVLDVGAGSGVVTRALLERGARVVAIELHPHRVALLREQFSAHDVRVVCTDASDLRLPRRPFKVVSNPPFAITTALVRRLTGNGSHLLRADLVVPWHVGRRWSRSSARTTTGGHAFRLGRPPPRDAFRPPPPGDLALLVIEAVTLQQ